jgi:hypothetical protein
MICFILRKAVVRVTCGWEMPEIVSGVGLYFSDTLNFDCYCSNDG